MPVMDGFEATRQIRAQENGGRRIPVIAVTAHVQMTERDKCFAAGMDDYLNKPTKQKALSAAIRRWTAGHTDVSSPSMSGSGSTNEVRNSAEAESIAARIDELRKECGEEVVSECVSLFRTDLARSIKRSWRALDKGDLEALAAEAHKLKGSAANMGAADLSDSAKDLQDAALRGESEECERLLAAFASGFEDVLAIFDDEISALATAVVP